ncbi:MAG: peptidylprolyl isomerase [Tissierellia bacterium]|nr:peptidylprolyl isomerase [Tissierellia bacterium]
MALEQLKMPEVGEEVATFETNLGKIRFRLFPEIAPKAVENFKTHIKNGYYDGTIFHRVIDGFMIQGGDPTASGRGGESIWGKPFNDEFHPEYRNFRGALSMANAGPNTNGSQFFIVQAVEVGDDVVRQMRSLGPNKGFSDEIVNEYENLGGAYWLDGKHSVFGQVFEGLDVVDDIAGVPTNPGDKPLEDIVIQKAYLEDCK